MTNELAIRIITGDVLGTSEQTHEAIKMAVSALSQPESCEDAVPRASVEYICRKNTVNTNPYEHKYHDKFIQFMDDPEISDFGRWQHSNGFNTALIAVKCDLDKVPSAQPEPAIPLQWIEAHIEWLKSLDNAFTTLTAVQISSMVKKWKDEQNEQ